MKRMVNKKARSEYEIQETLEAGIVLFGGEVKAIKTGTINLSTGFVQIMYDELWLTNVHVPVYQQNQNKPYDPDRNRKLLIASVERSRLIGLLKARGLTIIPLSFYTKGGLIKVELGIGRGKSKRDKRKSLKERDVNRDIRRRLRQKN